MRNFLVLCSLFLLSACGFKPISNIYDLPYSFPPNAPVEYKKGWEHGCKSGFSAMGNRFMKTFYKFTQDEVLRRNPTYMRSWLDSFDYCRQTVNRVQGGSGKKLAPGDNPGVFSTTGLNIRPNYDVRDRSGVSKQGIPWGGFKGFDTPGWGKMKWGGDVPCQADWLGRKSKACGGYGF